MLYLNRCAGRLSFSPIILASGRARTTSLPLPVFRSHLQVNERPFEVRKLHIRLRKIIHTRSNGNMARGVEIVEIEQPKAHSLMQTGDLRRLAYKSVPSRGESPSTYGVPAPKLGLAPRGTCCATSLSGRRRFLQVFAPRASQWIVYLTLPGRPA